MNLLMRMAAFRCLAPDDLASGGSGASAPDGSAASAPGDDNELDLSAIVDAAYEDATGEEEDDPEDEEKGKQPAADGGDEPDPKTEGDADPLELSADFVKANPDLAKAYGEQLDILRQNVEAVAPMLDFETSLADPAKAPDALRRFAENVAKHHGTDLATMLGLTAAPAEKPGEAAPEAPDWQALGFASKAEFDAAPDWQRAGYDSPGEHRLAKQLAETQALLQPLLEGQKAQQEATKQSEAKTRFEAAVKTAAPKAIKDIELEHGWKATEAQALAAAAKFPQLAAKDLKGAILAAHPVELAKHYAGKSTGTKEKQPEMPSGGDARGHKAPDPADLDDLTEFAYQQLP